MSRTIEEWRRFAEVKKAEEAEPTRNRQSRQINEHEFDRLVAILREMKNQTRAQQIKALFNGNTKYEALSAICSGHILGKENVDQAVEIAEAVAALDYDDRYGPGR